jgi:hypothetical protein
MRLIRLPAVLSKTGLSRSRLYSDATFPAACSSALAALLGSKRRSTSGSKHGSRRARDAGFIG